ncbi:MAG: mechanosensitive ion channel domain-containing protein [Hyphomicrobiaceae bacterium]
MAFAFRTSPAHIVGLSLLLVVLAAVVSLETAQAQQTLPQQSNWLADAIESGASKDVLEQFSPELAELKNEIEENQVSPDSQFSSSEDIQKSIGALEAVRPNLRNFVDQLAPKLQEARAKLEKLGPAPKDGDGESSELADQRKALDHEVSAYDGLIKRAEVLFVQAGQTISAFNTLRRQQFLSDLFRRSNGITDSGFFYHLSNSLQIHSGLTFARIRDRFVEFREVWPSALFVMALSLAALMASFALCRRLLLWNGRIQSQFGILPTRAERGAIVLQRALSATLPALAALLVLLLASESLGLMRAGEFYFVARFVTYTTIAVFLISAIRFALNPPVEVQRLIAIDTRSANAFQILASVYVLVWYLDQSLELFDQFIQSPLLLVVLRLSIVSIVYAVLLFGFVAVRIRRKGAHPSTRRTNGWPNWLFGLVTVMALVILGGTLLGYVSFARFLGSQIVATGGLVFFVTLMHLMAELISSPRSRPEEEDDLGSPTMLGATLGVVLGIALDVLILLIGLPLLLLQWGFDWPEVRSWLSSVLFGFQVGQLHVSVLEIFLAVGVFLVGLILTKLVRQMFVRRTQTMFVPSTGARDSLAAMLGYTGTILSLIAALAYVGIDFANLALIAGALSVGIGFGLQSIVNNFVSGLILLAERPIKVGDWIVVGEQQGRVQKISVRSTQIRLFDRSTLVMPNADLIANQVINRDFGDSVGRVSIQVGVSYASDPRQVIKILSDIGRSHPGVLVYDQSPKVVFQAFGDSSLDFVLNVHLRNIKNSLDVQTDLRLAILEAFRGADIEIPFPQRDLNLRSSDLHLERMPMRVAASVSD